MKPYWHKIFNGIEYTLLTGLLIACAVGIWYVITPRTTAKEVEKLLQQELPKGSSKAQVYKFLDDHHFTTGPYEVGPDPYTDDVTAPPSEKKRFVRGWMRVNRTRLFGSEYINLFLYFDEQLNLSEYKLKEANHRIETIKGGGGDSS